MFEELNNLLYLNNLTPERFLAALGILLMIPCLLVAFFLWTIISIMSIRKWKKKYEEASKDLDYYRRQEYRRGSVPEREKERGKLRKKSTVHVKESIRSHLQQREGDDRVQCIFTYGPHDMKIMDVSRFHDIFYIEENNIEYKYIPRVVHFDLKVGSSRINRMERVYVLEGERISKDKMIELGACVIEKMMQSFWQNSYKNEAMRDSHMSECVNDLILQYSQSPIETVAQTEKIEEEQE